MPERQKSFITTSSEPVERLSAPLDLPNFDYLTDLGFPLYHQYPPPRQYILHYSPKQPTPASLKYLLEQGQTALSILYDLPTPV